MLDVVVHPHALKHDISEEGILFAWNNYLRKQQRAVPHEDEYVAIGLDKRGRLLQIVGVMRPGIMLIIHAMMPPSKKVLRELGLVWR